MFFDPFKQSRWDNRYATARREIRIHEGVADESPSFHHLTIQHMLISWYGVFVGIAPVPRQSIHAVHQQAKEFADLWTTLTLKAGHVSLPFDARERERNMAVLRSFMMLSAGRGSHADQALLREYFGDFDPTRPS